MLRTFFPVTACLLAFVANSSHATSAAARPVVVDSVQHYDSGVNYQLACKITSPGFFKVSSSVSAELIELQPKGSSVKKGQLVARQDDAMLTRQIAMIKTDIDSARVAKRFAEEEYNRMQRLTKTGLTAVAELNNLKFQVDSSDFKIQRLQQELDLAQSKLSRLSHYAPFDAQVMVVQADLGTHVTEGQAILQLLPIQAKQLECLLPIISYRGPTELKQSKFSLDNTPLKLKDISQQLNEGSDSLTLYFEHPAKDKRDLLVGQAEQIQMQVFSEQITRLPNDAIELDEKNYRVWRVNSDDQVQRIDVKVLDSQDNYYLVESELRPGDRIVVRGQHGLITGQTVLPEIRINAHRSGAQYE